VQVVVVTGYALPTAAQLAALVEPAPKPVENDDLVPEGTFGIDRPHSRHGQLKRRQIIVDIGFDRHFAVRVERGFRARLDLDRRPHVIRSWRRSGIPDQQRLAVGISIVGFHPCRAGIETGDLEPVLQDQRQLSAQRAVDVGFAGVLIASRRALRFLPLSASSSSIVAGSPMSSRNTVTSMSSEKRVDQTEPLGQGGSALEEEAGSSLFESIEQGIQRPADSEVLLDILGRRTEAQRRRIEGAQHRVRPGGENLVESRIHVFVARVAPRLAVRVFWAESSFRLGRVTAA